MLIHCLDIYLEFYSAISKETINIANATLSKESTTILSVFYTD